MRVSDTRASGDEKGDMTHEGTTRFIEETGDVFETKWMPPSAGRIVGLLLISEEPKNAE